MKQAAWTLAFLVFDREAGRVRPGAVTGLTVAVLAVASHVVLSGPWMRQAGFPAVDHTAVATVVHSPTPTTCRTEATR